MSVLESEKVHDLLERAGLGGLQPRTLKAVAGLAAIVIVAGLWRFWPRSPVPEMPLEPPSATEALEESAKPTGEVVVHVAGAVLRPGVYRLPAGSRVDDALRAAGGGVGNAALNSLNLARVLTDGEQVYVLTLDEVASGAGPPAAAPSGGSGEADGSVVNINTATVQELEALPGVGPSTAQKIVDDREANGPFTKPEDLMRIPGIGEKKFESLREYVVCG